MLIGSLVPQAAFAFESFPEFQSLTEQEQESFDQPSLQGPEYQQHVLAYGKLPEWEHAWLAHDIALDTSVGSLSAVYFLMDSRAKVHAPLTSTLQFRFTWFDERNHDRQANHFIFELVFRPAEALAHHFGFSLYGEPSYYKRQNDLGAALLWWPGEHHEVRLFNTWVDVTRQKRNDRSDGFVDPHLPYARGVVGRWWKEQHSFIEYAVRYETKTQWRFPEQQYDYGYWKELVSLYYSNRINDQWQLTARAQADRKFESRDPLSAASAIAPQSWTTDRILIHVEGTIHRLGPRQAWQVTPGLEWAHRRWSTQADTLLYNDYLPHVSLGSGPWLFAYEFTWHRKVGGGIIDHPTDKDKVINHRLDVSYTFRFNANAELRLVAGFDLDAFGTNDTWEGGNGQFRWFLP